MRDGRRILERHRSDEFELATKLPAPIHDALHKLNPDASDASYGFRFAAGLDGVEIILSGMSSLAQVRDNIALAKNFVPLTETERDLLNDAVKIFKESNPVARSDFSIYRDAATIAGCNSLRGSRPVRRGLTGESSTG